MSAADPVPAQPSLLSLPTDTLQRIVSSSPSSRKHLSCASKALRKLWQPRRVALLQERIAKDEQDLGLSKKLASVWPETKQALVKHCVDGNSENSHFWSVQQIFQHDAAAALVHWKQLQEVETHPSWPVVSSLVQACTTLQTLRLVQRYDQFDDTMPSAQDVFKHHWGPCLQLLQQCSSLRDWRLYCTVVPEDPAWMRQLSLLTQLQALEVRLEWHPEPPLGTTGGGHDLVECLNAGLAELTRLTSLTVSIHDEGDMLPAEDFRLQLPGMPHLAALSLGGDLLYCDTEFLAASSSSLTRLQWHAWQSNEVPLMLPWQWLTQLVRLDCPAIGKHLVNADLEGLSQLPHLACIKADGLDVTQGLSCQPLRALTKLQLTRHFHSQVPLSTFLPALRDLQLQSLGRGDDPFYVPDVWQCLAQHPCLASLGLPGYILRELDPSSLPEPLPEAWLAPLATATALSHLTFTHSSLGRPRRHKGPRPAGLLPFARVRKLTLQACLDGHIAQVLVQALAATHTVHLHAPDMHPSALLSTAVCLAGMRGLRQLRLGAQLAPVLVRDVSMEHRGPLPTRLTAPCPLEVCGLGCLTAVLRVLAASASLRVVELADIEACSSWVCWEDCAVDVTVAGSAMVALRRQVEAAEQLGRLPFEVRLWV